jgi:parallel beta-helix repeat protein
MRPTRALASLTALVLAVVPATAGARTLYVNDAGADCSATAGFTTIQAAVDAAPAARATRIHVCPGTYAEHVAVNGFARLTLEGDEGARIEPPATPTSPSIVRIAGPGKVTLRGFKIDGAGRYTGAGITVYGVEVVDASAIIEDNDILGIRPEPFASSFGHAIHVVDNDPLDAARIALKIRGNLLDGYGQMGIDASGAASLKIEGNSFTGAGPTDVAPQLGVILRGVGRARVAGNTFSNHWFTPFRQAVALYVEESSRVRIEGNDFFDNYEAVKLYGTASRNRVSRNLVANAAFGLTVDGTGERNVFSRNSVSGDGGMGVTAIEISSGAVATSLSGNTLSGFAQFFDDLGTETRLSHNTCNAAACP